jgi:hypothetical protein
VEAARCRAALWQALAGDVPESHRAQVA